MDLRASTPEHGIWRLAEAPVISAFSLAAFCTLLSPSIIEHCAYVATDEDAGWPRCCTVAVLMEGISIPSPFLEAMRGGAPAIDLIDAEQLLGRLK